MGTEDKTIDELLNNLPENRFKPFNRLHQTILDNLPKGFEPTISYGQLSYVVPHSLYPAGYHCKPSEPLPFASLASQKNSINLYHMGIYANPEIHDWFVNSYPKHCKYKLDMGKSCVRFKKIDDIPYALIGELMQKISVEEWIKMYEEIIKK